MVRHTQSTQPCITTETMMTDRTARNQENSLAALARSTRVASARPSNRFQI
jgi:hypothetical protein